MLGNSLEYIEYTHHTSWPTTCAHGQKARGQLQVQLICVTNTKPTICSPCGQYHSIPSQAKTVFHRFRQFDCTYRPPRYLNLQSWPHPIFVLMMTDSLTDRQNRLLYPACACVSLYTFSQSICQSQFVPVSQRMLSWAAVQTLTCINCVSQTRLPPICM